jgi:peptide/nickel transport system substrate-binding protein
MRASILLALVLLAGCTNHSLAPADTLVVELEGPTNTINPLYTMDTNSQHVNELAHAPLVVVGDHLTPEPYLAESFSYESNTSIRFTLKRNCRFETGRPIDTAAVQKAIAFYQDPKNESSFAKTNFERIQKVEKIDDFSFRIVTDKVTPSLLTDLELLKIIDVDAIPPGTRPATVPGAGPYKVTTFTPTEISLERSGQPCLPAPKMAKLRVKAVRDDLSRFLKLKRGELDLVLNDMNYRKVELIQKDPSLPMSAVDTDSATYAYMGVNQASPKLRDPRVRMALAKSFDLEELIKYKSRGYAKTSRGMMADMNFYANLSVPKVAHDVEGARKLLDEAGWSNGTNGKPVLHLTLKTSAGPIQAENARVLAAQALASGIVIEHKPFDWGIFFADVKSGNTELYTLSWTGITDPHLYWELFFSGNIGKNNRTRYNNPEMDKLIVEGDSQMDPAKRKPSYLKIQEIAAQDLPFISLWHPKNVAVYRKVVHGVRVHPLGTWRVIFDMSKDQT